MEDFSIQPYDVVMLIVLGLTTLFGAWKGAAWQLASLASLVVSAFVAVHFSGVLAPYIGQEEWAPFAAMLILYLLTSLAVWIVFRMVAKVIDRLKLKEFDHQIGALFGLAKGILLCLVITFFAVTLSEHARQSVMTTYSGRAAGFLIKQGSPLLPDRAREVLGKYLDEFERKLHDPPAETTEPAAKPGDSAPAARPLEFPPAPSGSPLPSPFGGGLRDLWPDAKKPDAAPQNPPPGKLEFPKDFSFPGRT